MIEKIRIENYKNFKSFEFDGFKRVNLIAGKNNTGKTNLLEAIFLYDSDFDPKAFQEILLLRGEVDVDYSYKDIDRNLDIISSFFPNRVIPRGGEKLILNVKPNPNEIFIEIKIPIINALSTLDLEKIKALERIGEMVFVQRREYADQLLVTDFSNLVNRSRSFSKDYRPNVLYYGFGNSTNYKASIIWDRLVEDNLESDVVEALNRIFPMVQNVNYTGSNNLRKPLVQINGFSKKVALRSLGEGVNRVFEMLILLVASKNGSVFLDEIDVGIHYSLQKTFWAIVFELSRKLNVQIFATTHSRDCFEAFARVANQEENLNEGRFIRLQQDGDSTKVIDYDDNLMLGAARFGDEVR